MKNWTSGVYIIKKNRNLYEIVNKATGHWIFPTPIFHLDIYKDVLSFCCVDFWCPKTMKRRPCWCPKPVLWELNFFVMQMLYFVPINLHIYWPREWKHSISWKKKKKNSKQTKNKNKNKNKEKGIISSRAICPNSNHYTNHDATLALRRAERCDSNFLIWHVKL